MTDLITWSGCTGATFFVKSNEIRGIKGLTISSSAETKDSTNSGEKYTSKKNIGSYQITMTAVLSAPLGVDVQAVAMNLTEAARRGDAGYFYTANAKLFPSQFIATNATVSNITMTGNGTWTYCEVALTLKQSGKFGDGEKSSGGGSSGSSSSSKKTTSNKSTTSSTGQTLAGKVKDKEQPVAENLKGILQKTNSAKKASAAAKKNLTSGGSASKGGGGAAKMRPATAANFM